MSGSLRKPDEQEDPEAFARWTQQWPTPQEAKAMEDERLRARAMRQQAKQRPKQDERPKQEKEEQERLEQQKIAQREEAERQRAENDRKDRAEQARVSALHALKQSLAELEQTVRDTRDAMTSALLIGDFPGNEYRALDDAVGHADGLNLTALQHLQGQVDELQARAQAAKQLVAEQADACGAAAWAQFRKEPSAINALKRMGMAIAAVPAPDEAGFADAGHDLLAMRPRIEQFHLEWAAIGYETCLSAANRAEKQILEAQQQAIEQETAKTSPAAYAMALDLLPALRKTVQGLSEAQSERNGQLKQPRADAPRLEEACTAGLKKLRQLKIDTADDWAEDLAALVKDLTPLLDGENPTNERKIRSAIDRLKALSLKIAKAVEEEEQRLADEKQRIQDEKDYRTFKFDNSGTWKMVAASIANGIKLNSIDVADSDHENMRRILAGTLGDHGGLPVAGFAYHCHMVNGKGGLAFTYHHLGGKRVQPVFYDWAQRRTGNTGNIYEWKLNGGQSNSAPPIPKWIKANQGQ